MNEEMNGGEGGEGEQGCIWVIDFTFIFSVVYSDRLTKGFKTWEGMIDEGIIIMERECL